MKKVIAMLLALVMVFALCACGKSSAPAPAATAAPAASEAPAAEAPAAPAAAEVKLNYATGGTSGTYYGFSGVIANVLNEKLKGTLNIKVESTGASKANIQMLATGDADIAIVQNDVMSYAYEGKDLFEGTDPITSFSAVASCYPEYVQILSKKEITSIEQLAGKNVSVGDAGSGTEFNARQILAAYGLSFDDIKVSNQSFADSADALKNGTIDAAFVVAGYPTTAVTELATNFDFNLLTIDQAHADKLQADYGFYYYGVIPGGTYSPVADDVPAVAVMATIVASNKVPAEAIYAFVKGLFDYKADITAGHVKGNELDLNTAISGVSIPWHAGAEQFYKEQGLLK